MLEAKTLTIKKSTNKSGKVVNFIPEMVDDLEVYSVVNKNNEHCGYITEDLFNFLMEQDPEEKENKALIHRALGVDDEEKEEETLIFSKKIILDVSSTKDINDFEKIILSPVTYTKGAKPLTVKIGTFFCIQNQGKLLDINVKSDFIECDNFLVSNLTSTKLNIDLNNKSPYFGGIHLYGIENFQNPGDRDILCSLKNTVVELDGANFFIDKTKGALHLNNSIVRGATLIETIKDSGSHSLSIDNSVLDNARISLARSDDANKDVTTTISNSEIKRQLNTNELKSIKNSVIDNSQFDQVSEINDSICESASLEGKSSNILNGYGHTSTPSDGQENTRVGQAINDLEIL